jgi:hypothetical protein
MRLSQVKSILTDATALEFQLPDGSLVPANFHVTEVGKITKHFIDCGGTVRKEEVINFQLWNAADYDHRLHPERLLSIIELSEKIIGLEDLEIEVEYQGTTIQKFSLDFNGIRFLLSTKQTDCLAKESCGIPVAKHKVQLAAVGNDTTCAPGGNCC